jgi:hypothetical protein
VTLEPRERLRGELGRLVGPPVGDPGVRQRMRNLRAQQMLAENVGRLHCFIQRLSSVVRPVKPAVGLTNPVQRLCRAPSIFSLATDRQRLLLAVQSRRPITCGLADQSVVLQQAR